jgi:DNA-binding transcriptional regulator YhcF (GntR family)
MTINRTTVALKRFNPYIAAMTMWMPNLEGRGAPKYRAIADAIDEDVKNGALRPGARLPPHRDLAGHLGVTVTTITRAYAEAARRGLTSGHVGRGTFIRGTEVEDREVGPMDLSINVIMPDKEVAVLESRLFQRRVLPWTQLLGYVRSPGHLRHRQAMAAWLAQLGVRVSAEHLALTAGAQHAMVTVFSAITRPGETVLVEDLTYSGMKRLADHLHLKIRGVSMDAEGLRPDALDAACRTGRARVLYCMPRLQNPTSAIMSERRRRQIAAVREQIPPHCRRGRHLRLPLARACAADGAHPGSHDPRDGHVEELVSRDAAGLRCRRAGHSRADHRSDPRHDDHAVAHWRRPALWLDRGRHGRAHCGVEAA